MSGRRIAIFLWPLWAVLLGASLVWPGSAMAMPQRVASSAVLLAVAWLERRSARPRAANVACWIAVGMTCGFLGDAWALVPEGSLPVHRLIPAMLLFGLGHLAYIAGFLNASRQRPAGRAVTSIGWFLGLAVAIFLWQWSINSSSAPPTLRWSALAYSAILGSTTAAATVLATGDRIYTPVAAGAMLFLFSDFVLAIQAFRGGFPYDNELCWATYGPGQMLIVFGMARAARHSGDIEGVSRDQVP